MGVKNLCLCKRSVWRACKLSVVVDGHRTDRIDGVAGMVYVMHKEIA